LLFFFLFGIGNRPGDLCMLGMHSALSQPPSFSTTSAELLRSFVALLLLLFQASSTPYHSASCFLQNTPLALSILSFPQMS
jgi:hypothetical protein